MIAHAGFALSLAVTLRAAFFAYLLACMLGLIWALLSKLQPNKSSSIVLLMLGLISISVSIFNYKFEDIVKLKEQSFQKKYIPQPIYVKNFY